MQRAERSGSEGRKSSAKETQKTFGLKLRKRTELAADKCPTADEGSFKVKLHDLFSVAAVDQLVKQVNRNVVDRILKYLCHPQVVTKL